MNTNICIYFKQWKLKHYSVFIENKALLIFNSVGICKVLINTLYVYYKKQTL